MQAKVCYWKMFQGNIENEKMNTKCHKKCYISSVLQSNTYFKIKLSTKENFIKPTSINPWLLKSSRI